MVLNKKCISVSVFKLKPELYQLSTINLVIKAELLLLSTKNGEDRFNIALGVDIEVVNIGTSINIVPSLIDFINESILDIFKFSNELKCHPEFISIFILEGISLKWVIELLDNSKYIIIMWINPLGLVLNV